MRGKIFSRRHTEIVFLKFHRKQKKKQQKKQKKKKTSFNVSMHFFFFGYNLHVMSNLFSAENKTILSSAEFAQRVVKIKAVF